MIESCGFLEHSFVIQQHGNRMAAKRVDNFIQDTCNLSRIITDYGNAQHCHLAVVLVVNFGHGNAESVSQSVLDATDNPAFILEASGFPYQQTYLQRANNHLEKRT